MKKIANIIMLLGGFVLLVAVCQLSACGKRGDRYETNLLKNHSFEEFKGNTPKDWQIEVFRGLEGGKEVEFGRSDDLSYSGERSFYFKGDDATDRWFVLSQEIKVKDITHIRLHGYLRLENVDKAKGQFSQCNFLISFFDKDHRRFQEMRFGDKRTRLRLGSMDWFEERQTFRVPNGTEYVAVHCVLGMSGTVWFDEVALEIPRPYPWETSQTETFDFYWLKERPFPQGAMEQQQAIHDEYCRRLGITNEDRISYYLYPDTATIQQMLSLKGAIYISWNDREIHTLM
ncbi:MAG: hypothetical protein ABIA59_03660, partial [Candidatus Latescibacterota bacterium]